MTDEELLPGQRGSVASLGEFDKDNSTHKRLDHMAQQIETHGEIHATLEDGRMIEPRLGTTQIDYTTEQVMIFNGDTYQSFAVERIVDYEKPLSVVDNL